MFVKCVLLLVVKHHIVVKLQAPWLKEITVLITNLTNMWKEVESRYVCTCIYESLQHIVLTSQGLQCRFIGKYPPRTDK